MAIYLDHAATTPLDPSVRTAMEAALDTGNPSSLYQTGRAARALIDEARERVSHRLGCLFAECLFTSGGTEGANWAIIGAAVANSDPHRRRILLGAAEHHAVLNTAPMLARLGYQVEIIPVDRYARVQIDPVRDDTLLVSVQHANNEFGTRNDLPRIAEMARSAGALMHVDAVQTFGHGGWRVADLGADIVTVSAHKMYGPKGVGALYLRAGVRIAPLIGGGGQEREMRGGTENVAGIVGFGAAAILPPVADLAPLRNALEDQLRDLGARVTVPPDVPRLDSHVHVRFPGRDAETMLIRLDMAGLAASSGAACSSGSVEPSHVMLAAGFSESEAKEGLRFTLGRGQTLDTVRDAIRIIAGTLR